MRLPDRDHVTIPAPPTPFMRLPFAQISARAAVVVGGSLYCRCMLLTGSLGQTAGRHAQEFPLRLQHCGCPQAVNVASLALNCVCIVHMYKYESVCLLVPQIIQRLAGPMRQHMQLFRFLLKIRHNRWSVLCCR